MLVVAAPLRRGRAAAVEASEAAQRDELEAAKEAKYAEIRDAELDYRTGKLSEEDWRAQDRALRAEAIEILRAARRALQKLVQPPLGRRVQAA